MTARRPVAHAQQSASRAAITVIAETHRADHPVNIHGAPADRPTFPPSRTSERPEFMASVRARHRVRQPLQPGHRLVRCRRFPSCTDVVAVTDEHTDGGTWRGASHPPGQHRPATSPYIEIEHLAQIPPNLRSRQPNVNGRLAGLR